MSTTSVQANDESELGQQVDGAGGAPAHPVLTGQCRQAIEAQMQSATPN